MEKLDLFVVKLVNQHNSLSKLTAMKQKHEIDFTPQSSEASCEGGFFGFVCDIREPMQ